MKNKYVVQYYKLLRGLFPKTNYAEGRFIRDFKTCLIEFSLTHPHCTYEDLVNEFGSPEQNVHDYITSKSPDYLFSLFQKRSNGKIILGVAVSAITVFLIVGVTFLYLDYKEAKEAHISYVEYTIEEIDDEVSQP